MANKSKGEVRFGAFMDPDFISRYQSKRLALITSKEVWELSGHDRVLESSDVKIELIFVPDGEQQKEIGVLGQVLDRLSSIDFPRDGLIMALGGGATTDLAGFAASVWMRGVDWVAFPTTLAAMVDAAIGGKTGINLENGKNLVGAFHLPLQTIIDPRYLSTLSRRDLAAGLAEVIKCGMISDPKILDLAESTSLDQLTAPSGEEVLRELIDRAIAVKVSVVREDLRESGRRAILNFGHTLGHAIEVYEKFTLRHGEAVSIGMVYAAELSRRSLSLDEQVAVRLTSLLERLELPTRTSISDFSAIHAIMKRDKKVSQERLRFVLLRSIGEPELDDSLSEATLESVYRELFLSA